MQEHIILIDQITSISNCYFSFKYEGKFVSIPFLPLKTRQTKSETSSYHLDYDDLKNMNKVIKDIYPNSFSCIEWKTTLKPNSYMLLMLHRLQNHVADGSLAQALRQLTGQLSSDYQLAWSGSVCYQFPKLEFEK